MSPEAVQRVRIYLNERAGVAQPRFQTILERLRNSGASGATVLRGLAGFGPGTPLLASEAGRAGDVQPVVVEWVDRATRIGRLLPDLQDLIADALVTLEDIQVYQAVLRSSTPFFGRNVSDVVHRSVAVLPAQSTLSDAVATLLVQPVVALVDARQTLVSMLSDTDLSAAPPRQTLPLPIRLIRSLPRRDQLLTLASLPGRRATEFARADVPVLALGTPLGDAIRLLAEWGREALPVVDTSGQCVGLFGVDEALLAADIPGETSIRATTPAPNAGLLAQRSVPTLDAAQPAADALVALAATPEGFALLRDETGAIVGALDEAELVAALAPRYRDGWLAFRSGVQPADTLQRTFSYTAATLPASTPPRIPASTPIHTIVRHLRANQAPRLLIADDDNAVIGIISRRSIVRALTQYEE